jgi:pimeloyl-ACP methyl ester carboxylesterase
MIETNGITLRVVVEGDGPLLLLLHGFPQCWYLWRHQIDELVAAGYQVAVPDQRGYGGSDKPAELEAYDAKEFVADAVGIADALGHETFTLVTHDIGAVMGWDIALLHPERVTAVFALSVPPVRMQGSAAELAESIGDNFFHVVYFQQPGIAEAELDADEGKSLRMLYYAFSGDAPPGLYLQPKPASAKLLDGLIDPDPLPSWLTEADLDVYGQAYRDGFRGPINWYRGYRGDELLRARSLENAKITQPCHLMVGSLDPSRTLLADAFVNVDQNVTDLRGNILLDGAGHWLPLERTKEVNAALLDFLRGLRTEGEGSDR